MGANTCENNAGGYACTCASGYTDVGSALTLTCKQSVFSSSDAVISCTANSACSAVANSECSGSASTDTCVCSDGYEISSDRKSCTDIDECASSPCGDGATCTNSAGGYACTCPTNFAAFGAGTLAATCKRALLASAGGTALNCQTTSTACDNTAYASCVTPNCLCDANYEANSDYTSCQAKTTTTATGAGVTTKMAVFSVATMTFTSLCLIL